MTELHGYHTTRQTHIGQRLRSQHEDCPMLSPPVEVGSPRWFLAKALPQCSRVDLYVVLRNLEQILAYFKNDV